MVDRYPNLPGVVADITDGNLAPDVPASGPVTVIVGTGSSGPSGRLATTSGAGSVSRIYGAGSISTGAIEAFQGGASSVSGFRILATAAKLKGIGGSYEIETLAKGSDALEDLSILLDMSQGNDNKVLKAYDSASDTLVFASDGSADRGVLVGSGSIDNDTLSISAEITNHGGAATGEYDAVDDDNGDAATLNIANFVAGAIGAVEVDGSGDAYVQIQLGDGSVLERKIIAAVDGMITLDSKAGDVDIAEAPYRICSRSTPVDVETLISRRLGDASGRDLSLLRGSNLNGLALRAVTANSGIMDAETPESSPTKMNLFEGLKEAMDSLEAEGIDYIGLPGAYLDDEHVKHSPATEQVAEVATQATSAGQPANTVVATGDITGSITVGSSWLVVTQARGAAFGQGHDADKLIRCARILGASVAGNTTLFLDRDISLAVDADGDVTAGQTPTIEIYADESKLFFYRKEGSLNLWYPSAIDPDGKLFHEVNFGYELASFCQEKTSNESFCMAVVGVKPPASHYAPSAISAWYGKSPERDLDSGAITANGSGLLGNRLIAGGVGYTPGFFQTDSGYMDDSSVLLDANDNKIDMGKFLSIVASWCILSNSNDLTGLGYINSTASLYLGRLSSLAPWSAATGKQLAGGISLPSRLAKRRHNSLAGLGYVTLDQPRGQGVSVMDSPSAAMSDSDFTRNMTSRMVGEAISRMRAIARPYLGEPLSAPAKAALNSAIEQGLSQLKSESNSALESFTFALTQSPREAVTGVANLQLSLKVIGELRRVLVTVSLSL